jgi:hypothetical protein
LFVPELLDQSVSLFSVSNGISTRVDLIPDPVNTPFTDNCGGSSRCRLLGWTSNGLLSGSLLGGRFLSGSLLGWSLFGWALLCNNLLGWSWPLDSRNSCWPLGRFGLIVHSID